MQQDPNADNPYGSHDYESPTLPYVPHASQANTFHSSNAQTGEPSNDVYASAPLAYEHTLYSQENETYVATPLLSTPSSPSVTIVAASTLATNTKKRRLWLPIGGMLLLIVASLAAFFLFSYATRSTPTKTLDTFCASLQKGEYQTAYDQFAPALQANFTESQFAGLFAPAADRVTLCSHGPANETEARTSATLRLVHGSKGINNDVVTLTKNGQNQWQISSLQKA